MGDSLSGREEIGRVAVSPADRTFAKAQEVVTGAYRGILDGHAWLFSGPLVTGVLIALGNVHSA
jgi:hypothetical protein